MDLMLAPKEYVVAVSFEAHPVEIISGRVLNVDLFPSTWVFAYGLLDSVVFLLQ